MKRKNKMLNVARAYNISGDGTVEVTTYVEKNPILRFLDRVAEAYAFRTLKSPVKREIRDLQAN